MRNQKMYLVVAVAFSVGMALGLAGGERVELTTYPGINHDSWTQTYDDPALWEWLWNQRRDTNDADKGQELEAI